MILGYMYIRVCSLVTVIYITVTSVCHSKFKLYNTSRRKKAPKEDLFITQQLFSPKTMESSLKPVCKQPFTLQRERKPTGFINYMNTVLLSGR
jgi:hypothetical protein